MKNERKKIEYTRYDFRLHEGTYELLKKEKLKSGKSWNLFIYNLIKEKYGKENR